MARVTELGQELVDKVWIDVKDMAERAFATAWQVFLLLVVADGANWADTEFWKKAALTAIGAGLAAVKAAVKQRREQGAPDA